MPQVFNEEAFKNAVGQALELDPADVQAEISLGSVPAWDSLNHMNLIVAIEEAFSIRFESDEIPKLQTISLLKEALLAKLDAKAQRRKERT